MKGRPRSQQPKLAFEVRRYLTLVQVLALDDTSALRELGHKWGVSEDGVKSFQEYVARMAQHVIEYHQTVEG